MTSLGTAPAESRASAFGAKGAHQRGWDEPAGPVDLAGTAARVGPVTLGLLALWVAMLPFEPDFVWFSPGPVDLRTSQVLGLVVVASYLAGRARSRSWGPVPDLPRVPRLIRVAAPLLAILLLVSPLWSGGRGEAALAAGFPIGLGLALAVVVAGTVRGPRETVILTRVLALTVVVAALVGLWAMASGGEVLLTSWLRGAPTRLGTDPRLTRPFPHANITAVFLAAGLSAVVAAVPASGTRSRGGRWRGAASSVPAPGFGAGTRSRIRLPAVVAMAVAVVTVAAALTYSRPVLILPVVALVVAARIAPAERWWVMTGVFTLVTLMVVVVDPHWRTRILHPGNDGLYAVSIGVPDELVMDGAPVTARVSITNRGADRWATGGDPSVQLGIRWQSPDGGEEFATETHPLPVPIPPGATVDVSVPLVAPVAAGDYAAVWDLVVDREVWFAESTGSRFVTAVRVDADRVPPGGGAAVPTPRRRAEVSRPRIWREALAVWASRPLRGVGTGNFGAVASVRMGPGHQRVAHAHDLVLESLADWGVPGGLLLPLLVLSTVASMVVAALRREVASRHVWIVAAAVVLTGWSLVEWILPFTATGGLFWLVGGLWWSVDRRGAEVAGG